MSSNIDGIEGQRLWATLAGVVAAAAVYAIAQSLTYPLFAFALERQGLDAWWIGLSAAMTPLGFIMSAPFIPMTARRFGMVQTAVACALLAPLMLGAMGLFQNYYVWLVLRFLLGCFANPLYVISETWLIAVTPAARRGRVLGAYSSIMSAGFAFGPLTLSIMGSQGWGPYAVGIAGFLVAGAILFASAAHAPPADNESEPVSVGSFFRLAPLLLFAVAAVAAMEHAIFSMTAVYGSAFGSSEARISAIIATLSIGNLLLQIPLGRLAERFGAMPMMMTCALLTVAGAALFPLVFTGWAMWPLALVWGATIYGVYTMALVALGDRYTGRMLMVGNAAFALVWGVGGIAGAPSAGLVMKWIGPNGLPLWIALLAGTVTVLLLVSRRR